MKIVIPGGTGQVGALLTRAFLADGHDVVVLSRKATAGIANARQCRIIAWDSKSLGPWQAEIDGADVVINLAGKSVNCRYNVANRREIMESRVQSTQIIGQAITLAKQPPAVWLQASTATIYAHRYDAPNDEETGVLGGLEDHVPGTWRFSIDVATAWERACNEAHTPATRKVLLRSAMTMSPDRGGVFDVLLGLVRYGLGGRIGDGRQYMSWIHDHDFVRSIYWLIEQPFAGPVNLASPNPLPQAEFMQTLRRAWGARFGLPATKWMLEIGTFLMRSESELVLKSRRVVPKLLTESGFPFEYADWKLAANELCDRWRQRSKS